MAHNYLLTSAWETGPVPWADGVRNLFIEIKPHKISGRAVGRPSRTYAPPCNLLIKIRSPLWEFDELMSRSLLSGRLVPKS
jgi:hypothetical protein